MSIRISEHKGAQYRQTSDEQRLSEARSGNRQAFGELCIRDSGMLRQRIFQIVRHQEDAEDVVQEKYSCDVETEDGETLAIECRDPAQDPEQRCMVSQTCQKVKHAVTRLSPQVRILLEMHYKREHRLKVVAKALGISEATTKSRLFRARGRLRRSLTQNECWTP